MPSITSKNYYIAGIAQNTCFVLTVVDDVCTEIRYLFSSVSGGTSAQYSQVAWSKDGRYLAFCGPTYPFVKVYETQSWKQLAIKASANINATMTGCAFMPGSNILLLCSASSLYILSRVEDTFTTYSATQNISSARNIRVSDYGRILIASGTANGSKILNSDFTQICSISQIITKGDFFPGSNDFVVCSSTSPYWLRSYGGCTLNSLTGVSASSAYDTKATPDQQYALASYANRLAAIHLPSGGSIGSPNVSTEYISHAISFSPNGKRLYMSATAQYWNSIMYLDFDTNLNLENMSINYLSFPEITLTYIHNVECSSPTYKFTTAMNNINSTGFKRNVFYWDTKEVVSRNDVEINGQFTTYLFPGQYGVTYFKEGCEPITHGPYTVSGE